MQTPSLGDGFNQDITLSLVVLGYNNENAKKNTSTSILRPTNTMGTRYFSKNAPLKDEFVCQAGC